MIFVKNLKCFLLFLLVQNRLRNSFFVDVMDRRQAFPDYKNVDFTWLLNWLLILVKNLNFWGVVSLWAK